MSKEKAKKVKFDGCSDAQANWGRGDDPRKYLEIGKVYKVIKTELHSWHTLYYLEGFEHNPFNSACFDQALKESK